MHAPRLQPSQLGFFPVRPCCSEGAKSPTNFVLFGICFTLLSLRSVSSTSQHSRVLDRGVMDQSSAEGALEELQRKTQMGDTLSDVKEM